MEIHNRFVKFAKAEVSIIQIIKNSSVLQLSIDSVIEEYLENYCKKLKANNVCKTDLELLRLLLCQLYMFNYECAKNDKIKLNIDFNHLVEFLENSELCKDNGNQTIFYDVMVLDLIFLAEQQNFVHIFEDFQNKHKKTLHQVGNKSAIDKYLKSIDCFLSTWEILKVLNEEKDIEAINKIYLESSKKVLVSSVLHVIQTLVKHEENMEWYTLHSILSKVVSIAQDNQILGPYMHKILEKNATLTTLCALSDFIFPMNSLSNDPNYCLIYNRNLLKIIQDNLHVECSQKRKEARYLLKKLIDFIDLNEESLKRLQLENCIKSVSSVINPFICQQTESNALPIKQVRKNFILVLEALEEKQAHLVAPYMPLVETLINAVSQHTVCGKCFGTNWLYCVFARILEHCNSMVVKWGVLRLVKVTAVYSSDSYLTLITNALNNTFLYEFDVTSMLIIWFKQLQNSKNAEQIKNFLYSFGRVQWGPVPIFHVLQSLSDSSLELNNTLEWGEKLLHTMKVLVSQNIILHPPMIRSMSNLQLIRILCNGGQISDLGNLINFLTVFPEEDLTESHSLDNLRSFLGKINYNEAARFVKSICDNLRADDQQVIISMPIFSLVVQLLHEVKVICQTEECRITQELKALLLYLDKIDVRPYVKLSLLTKIIDFVNSFYVWNHNSCIKHFFVSYERTVFNFILKLFHNEAFEYKDIEIYETTLNQIFCIADVINEELEIKCIQILDDANHHSTAQVLFALKLWSITSHNYKYEDQLFQQKIKNILAASKSLKHCNELTGKAGSDFYTSITRLIENHLSTLNSDDLKANTDYWLEISSNILDAAGNQVLIYLSGVMKKFSSIVVQVTKTLEDFKLLIKACWSCNFGSKRDKIFWLAIQKLTECINSSEFLQNQSLHDVSKSFIDRMLKEGESLPALKYILLTCSDIGRNFNHFMETLLNGLLHGQVLRRDQRIYMLTCMKGINIVSHYKLKNNDFKNFKAHEFLNRQCNVDIAVRAAAVIQLCTAIDNNQENANMFLPLVLQKLSSVQNKRYFADSQLHRLKQRIMQTLLILQPYLNKESTEILYHALRESIVHDTDQHSIRLMKEWLLIRIYLSNEHLFPDLWLFFDKICDERPNSAVSLIGITWHIAQRLEFNDGFEKFISMALSKLAICCMGQQFGIRSYGQVFFIKVYELLRKDSSIRKEYACMYNATLISLSCGISKRNPLKVDEDFFYAHFHPDLHYSLETIYYQMPRLCNVNFEEFITTDNFDEQIRLTKSVINITNYNCDMCLRNAVIPLYIAKSCENSKPEEIESTDIFNDVQKKITPWRSILPNEDEIGQIINSSNLQSNIKLTKDIIVVASLVEKPQNLGGIARTCEIFGVKELVISNLKQIENKEFQALSVTADKWIKKTEAKVCLLPKYLMELKDNGWTLVGAEQTANSVNLTDYTFPKKTILVLGNEKNGIPANIIPLLDVCIEIPQYGVTRSLNVHVSSAICIWEYSKQHQVLS